MLGLVFFHPRERLGPQRKRTTGYRPSSDPVAWIARVNTLAEVSAPLISLACTKNARYLRRPMANYAVWNVRLRHESLSTPLKSKYLSRRKRARIGMQEALDRKAGVLPEENETESAS